ncbi:MurR/RpiR family transcriptional regulator [Gracilibacillus salinarum]|uniref:MurR/RpiR family transcriptional regulator n=1 Tax=Gracilibacillus salinarum TaxID=2932255 RepID=A0ABY4GHC8_9BACI|nr:MurR/RpiR family transcriptional regulator [Gracilibacillus salinarum]UOQ83738.1 MurR/RpiR family transcriptional regulator [Gracilibacillus salinarum]
MIDISKLTQGKNLSEIDIQILEYIIKNIDKVLQMGVRKIAENNYTSAATVIRLAKKLGYTGFVDMYYNLLPLLNTMEKPKPEVMEDFPEMSSQDFFQYNTMEDITQFIERVLHLDQQYIFIYATGFSGITAEYLYKKLLVLGKKTVLASGMDSVGVFENNIDDIGALVVISKSGETQQVIDKLNAAREQKITTVSFTKETQNRVADLSDINFKISDNNKLDDRNMLPNIFFPKLLMLFEIIMKEYLVRLHKKE